MNFKFKFLLFAPIMGYPYLAKSQEEVKEDSTLRVIEALQTDVSKLKKLEISGYTQMQYQVIDSAGAASFVGGNFTSGNDNRFRLRRARLKFTYNASSLSQSVIQFNLTESGVEIKDLYFKVTDPYINFFTLKSGIFDKPYGHEVEYSSSSVESLERTRMNQSLFKGETDFGAMLTIQAPKTSNLRFIKLDLAYLAGTSVNIKDIDMKKKKDFIGRLNLTKSFFSEKVILSGDLSYYQGGWNSVAIPAVGTTPATNTKFYTIFEGLNGLQFSEVDNIAAGDVANRTYKGIDMQVTYDSPIGISSLRGEYTTGTQVSTKNDLSNPNSTNSTSEIYIRNVVGYYMYFIQNILDTKHTLVFKYDIFDPNTKIDGTKIVAKTATGNVSTGFGKADIKYTDLGFGYMYRADANIRITLYHDIIVNEKTGLVGYKTDLKDNVWTLRFQYKF